MKEDTTDNVKRIIYSTPALIASVITLTICGVSVLNWYMSLTHYGQTSGNVQIPDFLINALMTILGYYFGNYSERRTGQVSLVSSFIAIVITLTVCGLVIANWWMSMIHYGKTTGIIIPGVLENGLSVILGFYFGSNGTNSKGRLTV